MSLNREADAARSAEQQWVAYLDGRRNKIFSATGGWFPGKGVFSHGYSMLEELVGYKSYFQILILNATGRMVELNIANWLEAVYGCLSWPDPRIWCNQVGALAGSARASAVAATALGSLAADSRTYGVYPLIEGVNFIRQALLQQQQGATAADIVDGAAVTAGGKPLLMGYVRPIAKGDERIEALERVARQQGLIPGAHLRLAYDIETQLHERYGESMNVGGYIAAVLADEGFSAQEVYRMTTLLVASGVTACYLDTLARPADSFLPLRCSDVNYQGPARRPVPD